MTALGIRISPTDLTITIIEGTQTNPKLILLNRQRFPKGYKKSDLLKWLYQEFDDLLKIHSISGIGIKETEPRSRKGNSYRDRCHYEGIIYLVAANKGINYIKQKPNGTISKDLGMKGRARYLESDLDHSLINELSNADAKQKDAIFVAWSMLRS